MFIILSFILTIIQYFSFQFVCKLCMFLRIRVIEISSFSFFNLTLNCDLELN